ncbi:extracellular solute-binding protein [Paenibacillus alginolyticus]|uniref:Extracellular solute-binding protein n=1 Tax=Paenibacillus alginolyticus TaxID=59839 RepID=A0ABT4G8H5_9BACL|nr:extracellular solute-binding protein [Paenibacillus alginolyticus]MCY9692479.1 extracellular solute-binding protein [Paenibacillus alginolyticus]MEC0144271.1 extracellular solute-binding protein [Paenibacillus alginolyticus]
MSISKGLIKRPTAFMSSTVVLLTFLSACSSSGSSPGQPASGQANSQTRPSPMEISVMMPSYSAELADKDSPILKKLNELTNTVITPIWVPATTYEDKFNITLSSGKLPTVMVVLSKTSSFISAVQSGAFWEIGPYLKDYKYLSQANPVALNNSSINGKVYGIYRSRPLGRNGIAFRKDWLQNVGLSEPKTVDDFYNMLKAFTEKDPDKNGKNDTYGMVISKNATPWDAMATWFGVPNKWGIEKDGKLVPAHLTPQYMEALKFFRKLHQEKLINQDFAVLESSKVDEPVKNGQTGVAVTVLDNAHRLQDEYTKLHPEAKDVFDAIGTVTGKDGKQHVLPTSGYAGVLAIPKSSVKTEAELKRVLTFFDALNAPENQTLVWAGIEGQNYTKEKDYMIRSTNKAIQKNIQDINQMQMGIPSNSYLDVEQTPLRLKEAKLQTENEKFVVDNPAEPLISKVYSQKGAQLDNIIADARVKFIVGQLDEKGFNQAVELWHKTGGDDYIKEINDIYAQTKKN